MELLTGIFVFMVLAFIAIFGSAAAVCAAYDRRQSKKRAAELERIIRRSRE